MKKFLVSLALTAMTFATGSAFAASESCDDPLKSKLGQSFCYEVFDDLAPGLYKVSFEYEATKTGGPFDRTLDFAFLFDSAKGPGTFDQLSDSTKTSGWNTYSFVTKAGGDSFLIFALLGVYPQKFSLALQNITVTAVPEPATYAMLLAGLGAIVFVSRRRRPQD